MATKLLTEAEVADLLGVKPKTLARWRWKGTGPLFHKNGRKVRYAPADVEDYLATTRRRSTSDPGPAQQISRRSAA